MLLSRRSFSTILSPQTLALRVSGLSTASKDSNYKAMYLDKVPTPAKQRTMGKKVTLIGSGNWGSAVATLIGQNTVACDEFDNEVRMYVYEEMCQVTKVQRGECIDECGTPRKLSEVINEKNENIKYLPGIKLPECIRAVPDLSEACKDADILIWVVPHQFVYRMTDAVKAAMAPGAISISLIKGGIDIKDGDIHLCSDLIRDTCGTDCSVLMGANLANEVAQGQFCEATIGYTDHNNALLLKKLFQTPTFRVNVIQDVPGVELCGALKNIVALGAGFSDGLGCGMNTKSAVMRIGLGEMQKFVKKFYPKSQGQTFFESCGVADLITTCFGGRNRKCAEAFAKTGKKWDEIEAELLNGQKLQGTLTCEEIVSVLKKNGFENEFPFIMGVHATAFEGVPMTKFFDLIAPRTTD